MNTTHIVILWTDKNEDYELIKKNIEQRFEITNQYLIYGSQENKYSNYNRLHKQFPDASFAKKNKKTISSSFYVIYFYDDNPQLEIVGEYSTFYKSNKNTVNISESLNQFECIISLNKRDFLIFDTLLDLSKDNNNMLNIVEKDLLGANNWESMVQFFSTITKVCNYVILRNHEFLPYDFFENDKDIDLLCDDLLIFAIVGNCTKRSKGISGFQTTIENQLVPIDIRFVGDDYYDISWEKEMLKNSKIFNNVVKILSNDDLFFSLLYHALLQKKEIKDKYIQFFTEEIKYREIKFKNNYSRREQFIIILKQYMDSKHYYIVNPRDESVRINKNYISVLPVQIKRPRPKNRFYIFLVSIYYKMKSILVK